MNAHEFLDSFAAVVTAALPSGCTLIVDHDFEAGAAYDRAMRGSMEELRQAGATDGGGSFSATEGEAGTRDLPAYVKVIFGTDGPQPELMFQEGRVGTGIFLRSYLYGSDPPRNDGSAPDLSSHALMAASLHALAEIQDCLVEDTHLPWPHNGGGTVPLPGARVSGDQLLLWFGEETDPVVRLPPIDVGAMDDAGMADLPD